MTLVAAAPLEALLYDEHESLIFVNYFDFCCQIL